MTRRKHRLNSFVREQQIAARQRREQVEKLWLEGVFSQRRIATELGASVKTVEKDLKHIHDTWAREDIRKSSVRRAQFVRRMEMAGRLALESFEVSKQQAEETTTQSIPRRCRDCKGAEKVNGSRTKCPACSGKGTVTVEVVTKRVKGQAGDPSFLKVYKDCMTEIARVKGLYPKEKPGGPALFGNGAKVAIVGGVDYSKVSPESVLQARQALLEVAESAKANALNAESTFDHTSPRGLVVVE